MFIAENNLTIMKILITPDNGSTQSGEGAVTCRTIGNRRFCSERSERKMRPCYGLAMHFYLLADPLHIYVGH
jgi:hypothetical protein